MDVSPFPYQGPLEPGRVWARHELVADLVERVSEHRVTALLGPRRFGKTSVLRQVAADVADSTAVIAVDLYEVSSTADLAVRLDAALAVTGERDDRLTRFAAAAELNLGAVRLELRRPPASRPDPLATVHAQLDVITTMAARTPVLVVFDEFSGITRVDGAAGLLRTHLQHHFASMGLLFAGSEPSVIRMLFAEHEQPFYAQADLVEIGPLSSRSVVEIVNEGFEQTGRGAGPIGPNVASFAHGHPQRSMHLADTAWRLVAPGGRADTATWAAALQSVRDAVSNGSERLFSSLAARQRDVMRIVAAGGSPFGSSARMMDLTPGAAQHARDALVDSGHLRRSDAGLEVVDPVFADWIRTRLPV